MNEIERTGIIKSENLSGEFYFNSLLEEAQNNGMVSNDDIEKLQYDCFNLLAKKTARFTGEESSSVPTSTAECISQSVLYTIGIALKSYPTPDDAVRAVLETGIESLYDKGRRLIDIKIKSAKHLYLLMLKNMIGTENITYRSTLKDGIKGFFKIYNPDYAAQEIRITADYPLSNPVSDLAGIEFIQKYIQSAYYENMFLKMFPEDNILNLLLGYDAEYRELVINIFNIVLTNAIGCVMLGKDPLGLDISGNEADYLGEGLSGMTKEQITEKVREACSELFTHLETESEPLRAYTEKALPEISSVIYIACEKRSLRRVFIEFAYPQADSGISFDFGTRMNDNKYREIIEEINDCRFTSDKIAIIESSVRSLLDLEDILLDAELTDNESFEVLGLLGIPETAALAKKYDVFSADIAPDLPENKVILRERLNKYISLQGSAKIAEIKKLYKKIK